MKEELKLKRLVRELNGLVDGETTATRKFCENSFDTCPFPACQYAHLTRAEMEHISVFFPRQDDCQYMLIEGNDKHYCVVDREDHFGAHQCKCGYEWRMS